MTQTKRAGKASGNPGKDHLTTVASGVARAQQFNIDAMRSIMKSSLNASQNFRKVVDEMQDAHMKTVRDAGQSLNSAIDRAQHAKDPSELVSMQAAIVQDNFARATKNYGALASRLMKIEAEFVQQVQAAGGGHPA